MQDDLDGLPSSLIANDEYLCYFHQTNPLFFLECQRAPADVFRMTDFKLSHNVSGVGSSLQRDIISFCRRSAWNLVFQSSRQRQLTLRFFT